jgi:hypothetical protein
METNNDFDFPQEMWMLNESVNLPVVYTFVKRSSVDPSFYAIYESGNDVRQVDGDDFIYNNICFKTEWECANFHLKRFETIVDRLYYIVCGKPNEKLVGIDRTKKLIYEKNNNLDSRD